MKESYCPDCRNKLINDNRCACGWFKIQKINHHRCQYIKNQSRCENEGTVSRQIKGNVWYCREHYDK
jgi:hypothetical protein